MPNWPLGPLRTSYAGVWHCFRHIVFHFIKDVFYSLSGELWCPWINICSLVSTSLEVLKPSLLNILQKRNPGQDRKYFSNLGGRLLSLWHFAQTTLKHTYQLFMLPFDFKARVASCFVSKPAKVNWLWAEERGRGTNVCDVNGQLSRNAVTGCVILPSGTIQGQVFLFPFRVRAPLIWSKQSEDAALDRMRIRDRARRYHLFVRSLPSVVSQIGKDQGEFGPFCYRQTWNKRGWRCRRVAAIQRNKELMVFTGHWDYFWASWKKKNTCGSCYLPVTPWASPCLMVCFHLPPSPPLLFSIWVWRCLWSANLDAINSLLPPPFC